MSRTASEGLALAREENKISIIELNSETDFVAKNEDFISFCKELSRNFNAKIIISMHAGCSKVKLLIRARVRNNC